MIRATALAVILAGTAGAQSLPEILSSIDGEPFQASGVVADDGRGEIIFYHDEIGSFRPETSISRPDWERAISCETSNPCRVRVSGEVIAMEREFNLFITSIEFLDSE